MLHVELLLLVLKTERRLVVALQVVLHVALSSLLVVIRGARHRDVLHHSSQVVYLLLQSFNTGIYFCSEILVALGELGESC